MISFLHQTRIDIYLSTLPKITLLTQPFALTNSLFYHLSTLKSTILALDMSDDDHDVDPQTSQTQLNKILTQSAHCPKYTGCPGK